MAVNTKKTPYKDRIKSGVKKAGECWEWKKSKHKDGYGEIRFFGKWELAHRASYQLFIGPTPEGLEIDHLCRNRACVNPDHLEAVTHKENIRRGDTGIANREKTHCPQGHQYSGTNLMILKTGSRACRTCHRLDTKKWRTQNARP